MVTRAGGGEPPTVGRGSSRGHRLGGHGVAVCSGGGSGGDGGVRDRRRWAIRVGVLEEGDGGELWPSWTGVVPAASSSTSAPGDGSVMVLMDEIAHSMQR
jgi:hypothetical protein